jgi:hypothetical protein
LNLDALKSELSHLQRRRKMRLLFSITGSLLTKEILYQGILTQAMAANGVAPVPFYPIKAAANYTLLYLMFRLLTDTGLSRVMEFGAGQSTLLTDAVSKVRPGIEAVTFESDPVWAKLIGDRVSHPVLHKTVIPQSAAQPERYADLDGIEGKKFDLVLVDGPLGTPRNSRASSLDVLASHLADEFVVVFDDAERVGEQDTSLRFIERTPAVDGYSIIVGAKCQLLLFSKGYSFVKHY